MRVLLVSLKPEPKANVHLFIKLLLGPAKQTRGGSKKTVILYMLVNLKSRKENNFFFLFPH